jgi:hypothetical protein
MRYLPLLLPISTLAETQRIPIQYLFGWLIILAELLSIPKAFLLEPI